MPERQKLSEGMKAFIKNEPIKDSLPASSTSSNMKDIKSELKRRDEEPSVRVRITTDLPKLIHTRLKKAVADIDTDSNKLVKTLIESFLDENGY